MVETALMHAQDYTDKQAHFEQTQRMNEEKAGSVAGFGFNEER